jgi:hypothetical protein
MSSTSCPRKFFLYTMALIISDLWSCGLLCFGSRLIGMTVGCCAVVLVFGCLRERENSLQKGHVKDFGSAWVCSPIWGGVRR